MKRAPPHNRFSLSCEIKRKWSRFNANTCNKTKHRDVNVARTAGHDQLIAELENGRTTESTRDRALFGAPKSPELHIATITSDNFILFYHFFFLFQPPSCCCRIIGEIKFFFRLRIVSVRRKEQSFTKIGYAQERNCRVSHSHPQFWYIVVIAVISVSFYLWFLFMI